MVFTDFFERFFYDQIFKCKQVYDCITPHLWSYAIKNFTDVPTLANFLEEMNLILFFFLLRSVYS